MAQWAQEEDAIRRVVLEPQIVRAYWSKERAWHGDTVALHLETRLVPDGTTFALEIWEDDSAEGSPDDFVEEVPGPHTITGNRARIERKLDWSEGALGAELALEGGELEFYFRVRIDSLGLDGRSTRLYVDLSDYLFSF